MEKSFLAIQHDGKLTKSQPCGNIKNKAQKKINIYIPLKYSVDETKWNYQPNREKKKICKQIIIYLPAL